MSAKIFIDGEAGTTGLQIRDKLKGVSGVKLASLAPEARKDAAAKQKLYGEVDVVILCLPDEAAKEAARLIDEMGADAPRVIDASSAHRVAPGWTYGFPELVAGQGKRSHQRRGSAIPAVTRPARSRCCARSSRRASCRRKRRSRSARSPAIRAGENR